jgi:hypothetical protein
MDQNGSGFLYLKHKFPRVNEDSIKEGILTGPQIRKVMRDSTFNDTFLSWAERVAWRAVTTNFLVNFKAKNYELRAEEFLIPHWSDGMQHIIKIQFLDSHLDILPTNLGAFCDDRGDAFVKKYPGTRSCVRASGGAGYW